jgi:ribonuclease HII
VVAAAVIMPRGRTIPDVDDSKKLSPAKREELNAAIRETAASWAIGLANHRAIDRDNIRQASFTAMRRAVLGLSVKPALVLADGWEIPELGLPCKGIVHGDGRSYSIACASILAKVFRDHLMQRFDRLFPGYGLARHKGYSTAEHVLRLNALGPSRIHRRTFEPVRNCIAAATR